MRGEVLVGVLTKFMGNYVDTSLQVHSSYYERLSSTTEAMTIRTPKRFDERT